MKRQLKESVDALVRVDWAEEVVVCGPHVLPLNLPGKKQKVVFESESL